VDRLISEQTLKAKAKATLSIGPYFAPVVKPTRSVVVMLKTEPVFKSFSQMTLAEQARWRRENPRHRLRKLADDVSERFEIPRRKFIVRRRRWATKLFIPIWQGEAKPEDIKKFNAVARYVARRSRTI
jgi:hypothetical protein